MHSGLLHKIGHLKEVWPLLLTALLATAVIRIAIGGLLRPTNFITHKPHAYFKQISTSLRRHFRHYRKMQTQRKRNMVSIRLIAALAAAASIVFYVSLRFLLQFTLRQFTGDTTRPLTQTKRILRNVCYVLSILFLLGAGWSFAEPYFPTIEHVTIHSEKISTPITIVQLSDFHCDATERAEPAVIEKIREIKPDLICFTGDGINSLAGLPVFNKTVSELSKIAPVYGVRGNWEVWWFEDSDMFGDSGMTNVANQVINLNIKGNKIAICGSEVDTEDASAAAIASMDKTRFNIFLHHYPAAWRLAEGKADLHLSGDTHGGQVQFPLIGPLIKMKRRDDVFYTDGLQKPGDILLYVNHGIGMEGGKTPRVRFNCPPEITTIHLLPENTPESK